MVLLLVEFCQLRILWGRRKQGCLMATKTKKKHACDLILKDGGGETTTRKETPSFFSFEFFYGVAAHNDVLGFFRVFVLYSASL